MYTLAMLIVPATHCLFADMHYMYIKFWYIVTVNNNYMYYLKHLWMCYILRAVEE